MRHNEIADLTVDPMEEFDGVVDLSHIHALAEEVRDRIAEQQPPDEQEIWRQEIQEELTGG